MALAQKFDVVSESHRFLYQFVLSRDMAHNACRQTYVLDSRRSVVLSPDLLFLYKFSANRKVKHGNVSIRLQ